MEIGNPAESRKQLEIALGGYFGTEEVWLPALQKYDPRQDRAGGLRARHPADERIQLWSGPRPQRSAARRTVTSRGSPRGPAGQYGKRGGHKTPRPYCEQMSSAPDRMSGSSAPAAGIQARPT